TLGRTLPAGGGEGANRALAIIDGRTLVDFVKLDAIEPLDAFISDEFRGRFIGSFLSTAMMDGKIRGLPFTASARALFFNKGLFGKAEVAEPPKTWDELRSAAEKV